MKGSPSTNEELKQRLEELEKALHAQEALLNDLRRSSESFRLIADSSYYWETWQGLEAGDRYASPACERITGYKPEEVVRDPVFLERIAHPDDRQYVAVHLKEELTQTKTVVREFKIIMRGGKERWIRHACTPVFSEGGAKLGHRSTNRDFTHLKEAEEAYQESEEKYRSLFNESRDAIYITSREGRFLDANQALLDLFGYGREELLNNLNVRATYAHPEDRDRFQSEVERSGSVRDYEVVFKKKDGTRMDCLLTATVRKSARGEILGYQGIIRDITNYKRAQEALKESSERIKRFAYSVSHDLKSPAVGIYGLTRRLHQAYAEQLDEKGRSYCSQIMKTAEQIAALAEQIMLYISSKENPLHIESIRLKEITQMLREEFSPQLSIRGIRWEEPDRLPEIMADRLCITRVLRNLVDNALKYAGDELNEIQVDCLEKEDAHVICITNNGEPIEKDLSERIFQAFERSTSSKSVKGVGLGLAIVRELSERHGGKAWFRSSKEEGTTFFVSIARNL